MTRYDDGYPDSLDCQLSILTISGTACEAPKTMLPHRSAFSHEPFDRFVDKGEKMYATIRSQI